MILVSDVHGAAAALKSVAANDEQLLVLGDLINFIDYRTYEGVLSELIGTEAVARMVELRTAGRLDEARRVWRDRAGSDEAMGRRLFVEAINDAYAAICPALEGSGAYVTYGNVDDPDILESHIPAGCTFVRWGAMEVGGVRVGLVGGGAPSPLGVPGEVPDDEMSRRLEALGPVDMFCTHAAPAIDALQTDVVGGRQKGSRPILDYLLEMRPRLHFFGDIHQPQATRWRVGATLSQNVGYFRATGRGLRVDPGLASSEATKSQGEEG